MDAKRFRPHAVTIFRRSLATWILLARFYVTGSALATPSRASYAAGVFLATRSLTEKNMTTKTRTIWKGPLCNYRLYISTAGDEKHMVYVPIRCNLPAIYTQHDINGVCVERGLLNRLEAAMALAFYFRD
jgi:hypothetical protein